MPIRALAALLFPRTLALVLAHALPAQATAPRFTLPDVPLDYTPRAAAGLERHFLLPSRNGERRRYGCCAVPLDPAAPPPPPDRTDELATLGRVLFHDPLLSRNGTRSCASCHRQERAFADGEVASRGFRGKRTRRNSMSIANLGFAADWDGGDGRGYFWDARARALEQLVLMPIQDPLEMGMDLSLLERRLRAEPGYPGLFAAAFGDERVDADRIARALAQFVRSIVSLRSRYDAGLAATGDVDRDFPNFTPAENRGKRLFFGDGVNRNTSCAACHVERVARGCCPDTWPFDPLALQTAGCRVNGVDRGVPSDDPGLGAITKKPSDAGRFRAPSLRNVELTGPYMHDGRFTTLEQVVQFYSDRVRPHRNLDPVLRRDSRRGGWGGGSGQAADLGDGALGTTTRTNAAFPMDSRQRADLVAFLKTLTDPELVRDERFSDPFARRPAK